MNTRPFGQAPVQELRELAQAADGYVVVMLTLKGVWRVLVDDHGRVLRMMTSTGACRQAAVVHSARAADVVLSSAFSLSSGTLLGVLPSSPSSTV